jgi:hypothetical protein
MNVKGFDFSSWQDAPDTSAFIDFTKAVAIGAQLQAINALPNVYGIAFVTESDAAHWTELDNVITPAMRTRLNTWLTARGYSTIPAAWTNRRVIMAVFRRLRGDYDFPCCDVMDAG